MLIRSAMQEETAREGVRKHPGLPSSLRPGFLVVVAFSTYALGNM